MPESDFQQHLDAALDALEEMVPADQLARLLDTAVTQGAAAGNVEDSAREMLGYALVEAGAELLVADHPFADIISLLERGTAVVGDQASSELVSALADAVEAAGDEERALTLNKEALVMARAELAELREVSGEAGELCDSMRWVAELQAATGDVEGAEVLLRTAVDATADEWCPERCMALSSWAELMFARGRFEDAEKVARRGLEETEGWAATEEAPELLYPWYDLLAEALDAQGKQALAQTFRALLPED